MPTTWADFRRELSKNTDQAGVDIGNFAGRINTAAVKSKNDFNAGVSSLPKQTLEFANLIDATVGDLTAALSQTIPAFKEGRNKEGAAGLIQMISSVVPMFGAAGPATAVLAGLVSTVLGIISSIVGAFEEERKTLATEIRQELSHLHAQLIHDELVAAMGDLERAYGPMQQVGAGSRTWEQMQSGWINMFEGNAAHQLNLTRSWLEKAENQDNEEWPLIFDCFWHVVYQRILVFTIMVTKLSAGEAQQIGTMALKERRERDEAFAQAVYPVALNRGTLTYIGKDNRDVRSRQYIVTDGSTDDYTSLNLYDDLIIVGPITNDLYGLDTGSGKIRSIRSGEDIYQAQGGAIDLWAMPEPNAKGPAGERLLALKKGGSELVSFRSNSTRFLTTTTFQGNASKIRQFRSVNIGGSTRYICLGDKGKIYSAEPGAAGIPQALQLTQWIDHNVDLKGITIGRNEQLTADVIVAYSENKILRRTVGPGTPFAYPNDDSGEWIPVNLPPDAKGKIAFAAASLTGQLLIVLDNKLWVFMPITQKDDGTWAWGWKQEKKGSMRAVCETPIRGFAKYSEFWKKTY